jgi:hypothetical protein
MVKWKDYQYLLDWKKNTFDPRAEKAKKDMMEDYQNNE